MLFVRLMPTFLLTACIDNWLAGIFEEPAEPDPVCDDDFEPEVSDDEAEADVQPAVALRGTVTVIPVAVDDAGRAYELAWQDVNEGVYPFGAIWVDTFTPDVESGMPNHGDHTTIIAPTTGANAWALDLSQAGEGPVYIHAAVDRGADGIIGTAEPSGLWHEPLELVDGVVVNPDGEVVYEVDLFVNVPWSTSDGGSPQDVVVLSGDATVEADEADSCAAMLFSQNWYGPYYGSYFLAPDPAESDAGWSFEVFVDQGPMQLAGACDTNHNQLIDPTDAWGTWVADGQALNPVNVEDDDISGLHLVAPFDGVHTTAEPLITHGGIIEEPEGFESYPAGAVIYVVAQRGDGAVDLPRIDHEYAWKAYDAAALVGTSLAFRLDVPAYKQVFIWVWVDLDGDGYVNQPAEPGGATGPWYTDATRDDLTITLAPAYDPE